MTGFVGSGPDCWGRKSRFCSAKGIFFPGMKVFVSSVITGFEVFRDAAVSAITTLGYEAIRAEDFSASFQSSRQECLSAVRSSDAMVLLLGATYGEQQQSGLSATHEEYREARNNTPVLAFVQGGISPEPHQREFIQEVRSWESGLFTARFTESEDLRSKVTRALHDLIINLKTTPVDTNDTADRARALIPTERTTSNTGLLIAVAYGPHQTVLRPSELDKDSLRHFLLAETLTGKHAVLKPTDGTGISVPNTRASIQRGTINVVQGHDRMVSLSGSGDLLIQQPARNIGGWHTGLPCLIEEDITERIANAFRFAARVLDRIDGSGRLTHFAAAVGLRNAGYLPWRTRSEHQRSPNQATVGSLGGFDLPNPIIVTSSPPTQSRAALLNTADETAHDLTIKLRWHLSP